jgi:hypothetical protein
MTKNKFDIVFIFLLCIFCFLLFYSFKQIGFSNDELSAYNRCQYNGFIELIEKGVIPDGHPAGVQVFLFYYIKYISDTDWVIKLPFVFFAILSFVLLYLIAVKLYNKKVAYLSLIFFIFSAFILSHSTTARPYSIGVFLNLYLFYLILNIHEKTRVKKFDLILITLISSLSFYTHYFSFLQSLFIWLFFVFYNVSFFMKHKLYVYFIIACLLFLPHCQITYIQLQYKGLGWLQAPHFSFLKEFIFYYANKNYFVFTLVLLFIGLSIFKIKTPLKTNLLLLFLFVFPYIILYVYSVLLAPVLQFPALIFSLPFLILFMCSWVLQLNKKNAIITMSIAIIVWLYSLLFNFNYLSKKTHNPYTLFIKQAYQVVSKNKDVELYWKGNKNYLSYYQKKYKPLLIIHYTDTIQHFKTNQTKYLFCNQLDPIHLWQISDEYPYIKESTEKFLYSSYLFSKENEVEKSILDKDTLTFNFSESEWSNESFTFKMKNNNRNYPTILELKPIIDTSLNVELIIELTTNNNDKIVRSCLFKPNEIISLKLKEMVNDKVENYQYKVFLKNNNQFNYKNLKVMIKTRKDNLKEYNW